MEAQHAQGDFAVRFEWGVEGVRRVAQGSARVVIVDVLRFSRAVAVAVDRGARVFPYAFADDSAATFAKRTSPPLARGMSGGGWAGDPGTRRS